MKKNGTIRDKLESKFGDLTSFIEAIKSDKDDFIDLPAGMTLVEFWELINEVDQKK